MTNLKQLFIGLFTLQPVKKDVDHHTISLEPVKFSFDEDVSSSSPGEQHERRRAHLLSSTESSDEEYFDADDQVSAKNTLAVPDGAGLAQPSRSISVMTIEGDPPDVEEDLDFTETEVLAGQSPLYICV